MNRLLPRQCFPLFVVVLALMAAPGSGQTPDPFHGKVKGTVEAVQKELGSAAMPKSDRAKLIRQQLSTDRRPDLYALAIALASIRQAASKHELPGINESRTDQQVGSSSSSSGSTSLVSSGSVPAVLGFAVENGALTRSTSGATITFRGRPVQLFQMLQTNGFQDRKADLQTSPLRRELDKFSFAVSFDTNRGTTPGEFMGQARQLSSYSFRYDIINHRDPRLALYSKQWTSLALGAAAEFTQKLSAVSDLMESAQFRDAFEPWLAATSDKLAALDQKEWEAALQQALLKFPSDCCGEPLKSRAAEFLRSTNLLIDSRQTILDEINRGLTFTFEYSNERNVDAPNLSNFKLILEGYPRGARLTANASATIFDTLPQGTSDRLRDVQAAAELSMPFKAIRIPNASFSLAGQYKYIRSGTSTSGAAATTVALKGNMVVGQAKITLPTGTSGVKIPISFSVANRTELIKEKDVHGSIGFTFDLDTLLLRLK